MPDKLTSKLCFVFSAILFIAYANLNAGIMDSKLVKNKHQPVLLKADAVTHDHEHGITQAKGNVSFFRGEAEVLEADIVTFYQQTNTVIATGNVVLTRKHRRKNAKETVLFANYAELTGDLKDILIKEVKAILSDNSKFVAVSGQRRDLKSRFKNARYSPCKVCREGKPVLWQLNAKTISWLEDKHDIAYTDVFMQIWDIPVFYLPYFRHPDPSVKRRSGFLAPTYGHNSNLGAFASFPYFYEVASDQDLTLTPLFTTAGGQLLGANYYYIARSGHLRVKTSGGLDKKKKTSSIPEKEDQDEEPTGFRGHLDAAFKYIPHENWQVTGNVRRVTDKGYLIKYPFYGYSSPGMLDSQATVEAFYSRAYFRIKGQHTQSTRETDRQRHIPLIMPLLDIHYESRPQKWGDWWNIKGNLLSISRKAGKNTQRAIGSVGWSLPWYGLIGDRFVLNLSARGDAYHTKDRSEYPPLYNKPQEPDKTYTRFFPQGRLLWELPFYKNMSDYTIITGPEVSFVTSPKMKDSDTFPNEDSYLNEPSDASLFSCNRLQGYDKLDDGTRLTYGVKATVYRSNVFQIEGALAQTHNFSETKEVFQGTGFEKQNSDLVGRLNAQFLQYLDLRCRFRLDKRTLKPHRNELGVSLGGHFIKLHFDYLHLPPKLVDEKIGSGNLARRANQEIAGQQVQVGFTANPHRNWRLQGATLQALGDNERSLAHKGSVEYRNECLTLEFNTTKSYYVNPELKPEVTYLAKITFKNLGSIATPKLTDQALKNRGLGNLVLPHFTEKPDPQEEQVPAPKPITF